MLSLSDLLSVETMDSVNATLLAIANAVGLQTTAWQSGQPVRSTLVCIAQSIATATTVRYQIVASGFLDLATGDWLTATAHYLYGVDRILAQFATGTITLVNASTNTYSLQAGDLIVSHNTTGKTYRNTAPILLPPGTLTGITIQADEIGTASNAAPTLIGNIVTTLQGVTVANPLAVLGADVESDPALRIRCREQQAATSPMGPKQVYSYVAKTPQYSATSSPITRTNDDLDTDTGTVTVYLATATGGAITGDVSIVQAAFDVWAEPMGFLATAAPANNLTIDVTATVALTSSLSDADIQTAIGNALAVYFASLPVGSFVVPPATGMVYVEAIKAVIIGATPGVILVSPVASPAADVAVTPDQVPVLGNVTITLNRLT